MCKICSLPISEASYRVNKEYYHIDCFKCSYCKEQLNVESFKMVNVCCRRGS